MCEALAEPICASTLVGKSLVVNHGHRGYVMIFLRGDIIADLLLLNRVNFDGI